MADQPQHPPAPETLERPEARVRITCGAHEVHVYPRRFSASFSAQVRAVLGKGPRTAYIEFDEARFFELDQLAEMVLIGHLQAGVPMTLAQAQAHPLITGWDEGAGRVDLEPVPGPSTLAEVVAAETPQVSPDPQP